MSNEPPIEHRVVFDFEVDFSNGGGIQGQDFRLDIDGDDISDADLAAYIVSDMRLLMVGEVRIVAKRIIEERHKRVGVEGTAIPHRRPPHRPESQRRRRDDHVSRVARARDRRAPDSRRLAVSLRRRDDVLHRIDPDGRQHRYVPGLTVPSVRGRHGPRRPAARARGGARRRRRASGPVGRSGDRARRLRRPATRRSGRADRDRLGPALADRRVLDTATRT